ncbi:MAG: cell division protein SepF [Oscillospiraceae bacterium]|jgi:FtsZ-interacting cell division protein YlmF|nr:cell division protein SepF [Oscillospiraceae bacterium]
MSAKRSWLDKVFRGEAVAESDYAAAEEEPEEELESGAMDGTYAARSAPRRGDKLVEFASARARMSAETAAFAGAREQETGSGRSYGYARETGGSTREFKDGAPSGGFGGGFSASKPAGADSADAYVVFKRLKDFTMASQVADRMTESKIVILNLESCEDETARRVLDFIGGVAYACGCMVKRIAGRVFMITPKGVNSDGEFFDEVKGAGGAAIRYDD